MRSISIAAAGLMALSLGASAFVVSDKPAVAPDSPALPRKLQARRPPVKRERVAPRLNRSRRWRYAESYVDARRISPVPDQPVR
jgi:hypothetical protein